MCGRFSLDTTKAEIAKEFKCSSVALNSSRFNVAPSQNITVVINTGENNEAVLMRWGLIPSWVKSLDSWKSNLINARVETIEEKPSFRDGFKKHPCLIPVSGFYEWTKNKQPYYFYQDKSLFALAGIWSTWSDPETEEKLLSCTILTSEAKGATSEIHHRMPVIISAQYYDLWLGKLERGSPRRRQAQGQVSLDRKQLLDALPEVELQLYPVSKKVNSPKNNTPDCIEPIDSY